jgi:hypothetical protein
VISDDEWRQGKELLVRIVAMLTRMIGQLSDQVRESEAVHEYGYGYGYGDTERPNKPLHLTAASDRR